MLASRSKPKPKPTLHARIRTWLLAQIQGLPAGSLLPTEVEVAKRFGASRLTAHKVLAELQRDGLLRRIKGKGSFVEPRSGIIHTEGRSSRRGRVIIAYPNWFSYDIWSKVERASLHARELRLDPVEHQLASSDFQALGRLIKEVGDVRGAIVIPPGAVLSQTDLASLDTLDIPVAVLVPVEQASLKKNVYSLTKDCFKAGRLMVEALARQGHQHIAYIANEPWSISSDLTYDGIKQGLYAAGLHLRDLVRSEDKVQPWEPSMAAGQWITRRILTRNSAVTALIYDSVPGAIGGLSAIHACGRKVPEDLSVVVNDDYAAIEEFLCPALSGIVVDRSSLVKKALRLILDPAPGLDHTSREDVRLVERASIAIPRRR